MRLFRSWKPKGKMYSLKCNQCGEGFLSSYQLEAPICGKCLQKAKSLDSTIEHEKQCLTCGAQGVIYGKEYCYSCYFGFGKKQRMNAWVRRKRSSHGSKIVCSSIKKNTLKACMITLQEVDILKVFIPNSFGPIYSRNLFSSPSYSKK